MITFVVSFNVISTPAAGKADKHPEKPMRVTVTQTHLNEGDTSASGNPLCLAISEAVGREVLGVFDGQEDSVGGEMPLRLHQSNGLSVFFDWEGTMVTLPVEAVNLFWMLACENEVRVPFEFEFPLE